jgi:hypothetical protein
MCELIIDEHVGWVVQLPEKQKALWRDAGVHEAPIACIAGPGHQTCFHHAIKEAGNVWDLRNQAARDLVPAEPVRAGAAQDSQHVVLGEGDTVNAECLFPGMDKNRSRAGHLQKNFLPETAKRLRLLDLALQAA